MGLLQGKKAGTSKGMGKSFPRGFIWAPSSNTALPYSTPEA